MHKNGTKSFELVYALGDSFTDFKNYVPLTTPPGELNNFLFDFGYSFSTTNQQPPFPFRDGVSYIQTAVNEFGVADEVVNVAVRGARAIGVRTIETTLLADRLPEPGAPSLFDILGDQLTEAQLSTDINLSAQTDRVIADFIARDRPENTAASILIGANDLNGILFEIDEALDSGDTDAGGIIRLLLDAAEALAQITASVTLNAREMAKAGIDTIIYVTNPAAFVPALADLGEPVATLAEIVVDLQNGLAEFALTAAIELAPFIDAELLVVDVAGFFEEVQKDPSSFGVVVFEDPFYLSGGPFPVEGPTGPELVQPINPGFPPDYRPGDSRAFFFDINHPNANAHDLIAAFYSASIEQRVAFLTDAADRATESVSPARDDVVLAADGDDWIHLGKGDDVVFAGAGDDHVSGGKGSDIVAGGSGDDRLLGGGGRNVLNGSDGDDRVIGGWQPDALFDGLGSDVVKGRGGDDLLIHVDERLYSGSGEDRDRFDGGAGIDTLLLVLPLLADQELVANIVAGSAGGSFEIDELGLSVRGIERVLVFDAFALPDGLTEDAALQRQLELADDWAVALPLNETLSIADAIFDSSTLI